MAAYMTLGQGRVVAFIDLGSNSLRLLVAYINAQGDVKVLNEAKQMVRLGDGAFRTHHLQPEAVERTLATLSSFADMCRGYGVVECVPVATAAVRDAVDADRFLHLVRMRTGFDFTVISGKEEARLIWRGVSAGLEPDDTLSLYLDIGGGSTEMAAASTSQARVLDSLKIGCVRLANLFPTGEGPVKPSVYAAMQEYVRSVGVHAFRRLADLSIPAIVASSGTAQNLAQITEMLGVGTSRAGENTARVLTYRGLVRTVRELCSRTREERARVPGLNVRRLDVIVPGAAILQTVLEELNFDTALITSRGLRDGLVREYVERNCPAALRVEETGVREKSVLGLARACRFEEPHSRHVQGLALELFDTAREAGLHSLGEEVRELLSYAALLHDVGIFISFSNHHAHSHYLIVNYELLGFTAREVGLMAAMAYFHRAKPSKKQPLYNEMEPEGKEILKTASIVLTLAEALDKSHGQIVRSAAFHVTGEGLTLEVECVAPAPLERGRVARLEERMAKLYDRPVTVVFHEPAVRRLGMSADGQDADGRVDASIHVDGGAASTPELGGHDHHDGSDARASA